MDFNSQEVQDAAKYAMPIVKDYVVPKIKTLIASRKVKKEYEKSIKLTFANYLERSYESNSIMNTLALKDHQMKIDDLYIPLTVNYSSFENGVKVDGEITINCYDSRFLPKFRKILLVDNAGMGKSTIIKYLFLKVIEENKGIPLLIELRKLRRNDTIIDYIINEINGIEEYLDEEDIYKMINDGDFIFFLDGYDEIKREDIEYISIELEKFISKSNKNNFILSSRDEKGLSSFGSFQRFNIRPLKRDESYKLLKKYDIEGKVSDMLVEELEKEENFKVIHDFLENPLMVSLLFMTYKNKKIIPNKKNIFYKYVYECLFEDHDLSKMGGFVHEKNSKLDIDEFEKFMCILSAKTFDEGVSYSEDKFEKIISDIKLLFFKNYDFNSRDIIKDLLKVVPFFLKEGNEYRWVHKSFQEFFLAKYIYSSEKRKKYLHKISNEKNIGKFYNVLDFYYDIDIDGFEKYIIMPFLNNINDKYKVYFSNVYYKDFDKLEIEIRKSLMILIKEAELVIFDYNDIGLDELDGIEYLDAITDYAIKKLTIKPTCTNQTDNLLVGYNINNQTEKLMYLLYSKSSRVVKEMEYDILNAKLINVSLDTYSLDDSIDNRINNIDNFSSINSYVAMGLNGVKGNESDFYTHLMYDENECIKKYKEISEKIKDENNELLFLD